MLSRELPQKVTSTTDFDIIFDTKLKFSEQCNYVVNQSFSCVNILLKCFHSRDRNKQIKLFNTLVRPILVYNSPIWSPHLKT